MKAAAQAQSYAGLLLAVAACGTQPAEQGKHKLGGCAHIDWTSERWWAGGFCHTWSFVCFIS